MLPGRCLPSLARCAAPVTAGSMLLECNVEQGVDCDAVGT